MGRRGPARIVAWLPSLLGLGAGDVVVHPATAYPTYDVGARLAGATPLPTDDVAEWDGAVRLVWVNSPGNPDGTVRTVEELRGVVEAARQAGAVVVADECYAELSWEEPWASAGVPSILDPRVTGGDLTGVLALYSLSKQSNLAGYRAAFAAGDPALVSRLLEIRKHAGMIVPGPVQAAMTAALGDDTHVAAQREVYRRRRAILLAGLADAGLAVDGSEAGLSVSLGAAGVGLPGLLDDGLGPGGARHTGRPGLVLRVRRQGACADRADRVGRAGERGRGAPDRRMTVT